MKHELTGKEACHLHLRPWQEIIGKCIETSREGDKTVIVIETLAKPHRFKLLLPNLIENAQTLIGQTVGIIKTDDMRRPFSIRKITIANHC